MKEYLEYLEKLNVLVDKSEFDEMKEDYQQCKSKTRLWGCVTVLLLLPTFCALIMTLGLNGDPLHSLVYSYKHGSGDKVLWLVLFFILLGFSMWSTITSTNYNVKMESMQHISYFKHSYSTIRNTIIDEGEEFMRKLFVWERLYTLTEDDRTKYDYVLKVIYNLGLEYTRFENKGV